MKIIFVLPSIGIGGGVRIVTEYANHLVDRGHDVCVIYPRTLTSQLILRINPNRFFIKKIAYYIIKTLRFSSKPKLVNGQKWFELKAKLIEVPTLNEKYIPEGDAIIATWWETAFSVANFSENKGKKFYLIQHYEIWGGPEKLVHQTYKFNIQKIIIAKWIYRKLMDLGVPEDQMKYIPNAINFDNFKVTMPMETRNSRVAMQFNDNVFKGINDGINTLIRVKRDYSDLKAILFGISSRPKYLPEWIEYIQNPSQDELINNIYNKSSIYLCSSWAEGWHLPPAEAMACGCAVVSTDIGGVEDYAIDEVTALLSPPKNPDLLAKNLLRLLKDDEFRLKLAKAGNKNIRKFNWKRTIDEFENLLKK